MGFIDRCVELVRPSPPSSPQPGEPSMNHTYVEFHHVIDLFVMNRLSQQELREFLAHRRGCERCQHDQVLQEVFVKAMKEALADLPGKPARD